MNRAHFIGKSTFFFARAHTRLNRSLPAGRQARLLVCSFCLILSTIPSFAQEPQFIRGRDSFIHGVVLDRTSEQATRKSMGISDDCQWIKKRPTAMALVGSEGASVDPHIKSTRGVIVLEGLNNNADPKVLHTRFLSQYKNHPSSIPAEIAMLPGSRYPLAVTISATLAGEGDLIFQKGDYLIVHADGQLYSYALPEITIPSEGVLRLYLGTDDTLYYDAALTHPAHPGACGRKK